MSNKNSLQMVPLLNAAFSILLSILSILLSISSNFVFQNMLQHDTLRFPKKPIYILTKNAPNDNFQI